MNRVNVVSQPGMDIATAQCGLCSKPIAEHVTDAGFGCPDSENKHPLRRESDSVVFVPLVSVMSALRGDEGTPAKAQRGKQRKAREARAKERPGGDAAARSRAGRVAGLYVIGKKTPTKLTDSGKRVYGRVKTAKNGISQRDIAAKLDMSTGTVGWVLGKLKKQGAVRHVPAAS